MFDLTGRTALVTGAGRGLGAEIARVLAAHGAAVAVNDLFADRADAVAGALEAASGRAVAVPADVTDLAAVRAMVDAAKAALGPVDILVNNAGVPPDPSWDLLPFHRTDPASWHGWVDLNLYGVLNCCHATVGGMVERGWGRVITIVSDAGRTGEANLAVYCAAKAAAAGFSRALAKEVGPHGVTANAVALGTLGIPGDPGGINDRLSRRYPVGRVGAPDDVAPAVLWLASAEAAWVTGQTIPVNGGYATS